MDKAQKQNPQLKPLEVLIGKWQVKITNAAFLPRKEDVVDGPATTISWVDGGALLRVHSEGEADGPPSSLSVVGRDMKDENFTVLYYDERGVSRIYEMSFKGTTWKMWRDALEQPFSQRFEGIISSDGTTIQAFWEKSLDGKTWEHDFDMIYTRHSTLN